MHLVIHLDRLIKLQIADFLDFLKKKKVTEPVLKIMTKTTQRPVV